jgi:glycine cleavage system H lipoate-binding protein
MLNSDPYGEGWLIRVRLDGEVDTSALLDPEAYAKLCEEG